jgi:rod shape-determining protein MreC
MYQLFQFIAEKKALLLFIFLEILSLWCVFSYNNYPSSVYFNTSNYYVAKGLETSNAVKEYTNLREVNASLAAENARLNETVNRLQNAQPIGVYKPDSIVAARFKFVKAKVVRNTVNQFNNYITIDKGTADGIQPGMGIISATGVVGKVKACNEHYSVLYSILHSQNMISSQIKRNSEVGSVRWDGVNPDLIQLQDVSRYKSVKVKDTVVTSQYNSLFPSGIMVGIVKKLGIQPDQTFWDIELQVATDFRNLSYVYVIDNRMKQQQETLEAKAIPSK